MENVRKQNLHQVFIVVAAVLLLLLPLVINSPYYIRLVLMISIYALLGLGLNFLFGYTGQISIGHAAFYAFGAYGSAILETQFNVPFPIAWAIALLFTALVAYLVSFPILKLKGHYLAMATLAFGLIVETIIVQWKSLTGGHDGITVLTADVLGPWLAGNLYYPIVGSAILIYWFLHNLTHSAVGRAHQALRDDEDAAEALGIPVSKHKVHAFVFSAVLAALAGIWYVHMAMVITPEVFGLHTSITILMMVVVGGLANNFGAVLGAAFIILLPELLSDYQEASLFIYGVIVLMVLVFFPKGLAGIVQSAANVFTKRSVNPGDPAGRKEDAADVPAN